MGKISRRTFLKAATSTAALAAGVSITGTAAAEANASKVHGFLNTSPSKITDSGNADTQYFKSAYASCEEVYEANLETNKNIQEEGSVLLKNDGTLPLAKGAHISVFSRSCADIVYGGTGSGSIDTAVVVDLHTALTEAGFALNETLWDFYAGQAADYTRTTSDVAEVPLSKYTDAVKTSYADYADAAVVVISRTGGEGDDLHPEVSYLDLQPDEREMLAHVKENFSQIVVLLNSSNPLCLGWLEEYGVNACLWIGGPGQTGLTAVAEMLVGDRVPSGKLADTYAASADSAPAAQNFGEFCYTNAVGQPAEMDTQYFDLTNSTGAVSTIPNSGYYIVEAEGIYVGYAYYETRYEDCVLGRGNASSTAGTYCSDGNWNYSQEVCFPFGFGLSYTTFSQSLDSVQVNGDTVTVTATVKNTGSCAGKDVVEIYAQAPYTVGGIEKAAVQLCGYAKTEKLEPGKSQTLTVEVDLHDVASYDQNDRQAYVLEAGTYYFTIGNGAHAALNNILAAKGYTVADGMDAEGDADLCGAVELAEIVYNTDPVSGAEIHNLFEDADLNYFQPGKVTYLSRSDWKGTWPTSYAAVEATDEMIQALQNNYTACETDVTDITYNADNGLTLAAMIGLDYEDAKWDDLLDQMSLEEQVELVQAGASQTAAVASIAFAGTVDADGPAGLGSMTGRRYYYETIGDTSSVSTMSAIGYNSAVVIASTWSQDAAWARGQAIGEDGLWTNTVGWWGPGANTHRSPYCGRNFEYYSEDPFLGGTIGAQDIAGAQAKGMRAFCKHFAANDQELHRHGLSTFANEQALRQIYLKQFQYVVQRGGTLSLMESFNRIGCKWAGGDYALCTELLRGEWGFKGSVLTDFNFFADDSWMNIRSGLAGGTDQWLALGTSNLLNFAKQDIALAAEVRQASHRVLYAVAQTAGMNGLSETAKIEKVTAWWEKALYGMCAGFGVLTVAGLAWMTKEELSPKETASAAKKEEQ